VSGEGGCPATQHVGDVATGKGFVSISSSSVVLTCACMAQQSRVICTQVCFECGCGCGCGRSEMRDTSPGLSAEVTDFLPIQPVSDVCWAMRFDANNKWMNKSIIER